MHLSAFYLLTLASCCLLGYAYCQCIDNYEPGCRMPVEIGRPQRHCIDPTKYWKCSELNAKAALLKCGPNSGFSQEVNACIPWIEWIWRPCVEPPSRPTGWVPCYQN